MTLANKIVMMRTRSQLRSCEYVVCMLFWALLLPITGAQNNAGSRAEAFYLESPCLLPQDRRPCHKRRAATAKLTALFLDSLCSVPLPPISGHA